MGSGRMEFQEVQQRAMEIRQRYAALEQAMYGRSWSGEEIAMGLSAMSAIS